MDEELDELFEELLEELFDDEFDELLDDELDELFELELPATRIGCATSPAALAPSMAITCGASVSVPTAGAAWATPAARAAAAVKVEKVNDFFMAISLFPGRFLNISGPRTTPRARLYSIKSEPDVSFSSRCSAPTPPRPR
ncbi:MAG: hypothetical protein NW215_11490 [Hyphomicrobiales bacterium]|nr:hypothetical protein [Hyphomicrobiales bacterium]